MIDLTQEMRSAADASTAARPDIPSAPVLARIRHRRTVRTVTTSTAGVAMACAVAVGGWQIAATRTPQPATPPASSQPGWPAAVTPVGEIGGCGSAIPALDDPPGTADVHIESTLSSRTLPVGATLTADITLAITTGGSFWGAPSAGLQLLVVRDGTVVATSVAPATDDGADFMGGGAPEDRPGDVEDVLPPGAGIFLTWPPLAVDLVTCDAPAGTDAAPLEAGSYALYAAQVFTWVGGDVVGTPNVEVWGGPQPLTVAGGPWEFTIEPSSEDSATDGATG